jgi:CRP-like cAMP-binding protein
MSPVTPETFPKRFPELGAALDPPGVEALLAAVEIHDADAGEALVAQGTPTDELFLVWDGRLDITMSGVGGARTLAGVEPGSCFGEVSLLDPGPAGASVVTEQGCVVLRLRRERLDELRGAHPEVAAPLIYAVLRSLSDRKRAATRLLEAESR